MVEVIAEVSGSHGGHLDNALTLVDHAADAGATILKTQCFDPETLTLDSDGPGFIQRGGLWDGRKLIDLYRETATPWDWHATIAKHAQDRGMGFMASVFCKRSVDFIAALKPFALKIATLELVDTPLIEYAASTGLPLVMSCGMASPRELNDAIEAARAAPEVVLLACPPGYPAPVKGGQFRLPIAWEGPWGLSDHSRSMFLAPVAVARGASMIERHIKLVNVKTPDDAFAFIPEQFKAMVIGIRDAETAIQPEERRSEPHRDIRRSIYAVADIKAGDTFTEDNIRSIRPGHGLPPRMMPSVLGCHARHDMKPGTPLHMDDIA